MKSFILILVFTFIPITISAQEKNDRKVTVGYEIDALPFITGGYYGSMWLGSNHIRGRAVIAEAKIPSFLLDEGFIDNRIKAYALLADYFFNPGFESWWAGAGFEYWKGRIGTDAGINTEKYEQLMFTAGGGYVWKFHKTFYLNPWAGIHARIAGDNKVFVDEKEFKPAPVIPEVSVKVGWHFRSRP